MDDLTRDSWDVMSGLAYASKERAKALEKARVATEEAEKLNTQIAADLAAILSRMETAGVESVLYGNSIDQFVVTSTMWPGFLRPIDAMELDRAYEKATGVRPGSIIKADPADMVDLTQPAHEAATAPSNN